MHDLVEDVVVEMTARRARSVMMIVAVGLSVGALLCSLGIAMTAARQVDADLAASTVDVLTVSSASAIGGAQDDSAKQVFPDDADELVEAVGGVVAAGRYLDVSGSVPGGLQRGFDDQDRQLENVTTVGARSGYLAATRASTTGTSTWLLDGLEPVVVLGTEVAAELDIPVTRDPTGISIDIDSTRFEVVGFVSGGTADLSRTVMVPYARAVLWAGSDRESRMLVRTQVGAGASVARVVRLALDPGAPERLRTSTIIDAGEARAGVSTQMDRLAAGVGGLLLLLAILLIANSMVVSVMSRASEIGLRRAVGSTARYVAMLFLLEGGIAGSLGGAMGSAVAAVTLVAISLANEWTVVMSPWLLLTGPLVGALTGLLSSAYPAFRAAGIDPALAVRAD